MATKITTSKARASYAHLEEPVTPIGGGDPKYSVTLLIPKSDTVTMEKIKAAMAEARESYCRRNGANALPAKPNTTLHDGDGLRDSGEPYGDECRGCWVMTVSSKKKPALYDRALNEIMDSSEIYSGCWIRASINFYAYSTNGKKGISAELLGVQKWADGEAFGTVASASDFNDGYTDGTTIEDDDDFLA